MSSAMIQSVEDVQPFARNNADPKRNFLWILNELCNIDKHRTFHLAQIYLRSAKYDFVPPSNATISVVGEPFQAGPLRSGEILCRFQVVPSEPLDSVEAVLDFKFSCDITFKEGSPEAKAAISGTLETIPVAGLLREINQQIRLRVVGRRFERFFN